MRTTPQNATYLNHVPTFLTNKIAVFVLHQVFVVVTAVIAVGNLEQINGGKLFEE
jgi:hypothetical protein